jgi:hypothetical protein
MQNRMNWYIRISLYLKYDEFVYGMFHFDTESIDLISVFRIKYKAIHEIVQLVRTH